MEVERGSWMMGPEMPHEKMMDKYDIRYTDLGMEAKQAIQSFDVFYHKALENGIDENEHEELIRRSYELVEIILKDQSFSPR